MKIVNTCLPFHSLKAFVLLGLSALFLVGVVNATETADDALITLSTPTSTLVLPRPSGHQSKSG
jgi:hypothetical protein